jgi:lipoprotein-releasing system permease protein
MDRLLVALRYILARPISLVSLLGVLVGVGAIVVVDSVMNGFLGEQKEIIRGTLPDVSVRLRRDVREDPAAIAALRAQVAAVPGVAATSLRLQWPALYQDPSRGGAVWGARSGKFHFLQVVGADFDDAAERAELCGRLGLPGESDPLAFDATRPEWREQVDPKWWHVPLLPVLFGERLATQMDIKVGEVLSLATFGDDGSGGYPPRKRFFVVAGKFQSRDEAFDLTHAFVRRTDLVDFAGLREGAREIAVQAEVPGAEALVRDRVRQALAAAPVSAEDVQTWADQKSILLRAIQNERSIMNFVLFFLVLVAAFNLFVTLSMMVSEKVREIGILVSLGAGPAHVATLFLSCGLLVTFVGALLGLAGGIALTVNINAVHDFISHLTGFHLFNPEYYSFNAIPADMDAARIAWFVVATFACAALFTLVPSWQAGRMEVVDALRHE